MKKSKHAFNKKLCFLLQNKPNLTIKQYIHILSSIYETSINTDVKITLGKKRRKNVISLKMIIYRWQRYHKDEFFKISVHV